MRLWRGAVDQSNGTQLGLTPSRVHFDRSAPLESGNNEVPKRQVFPARSREGGCMLSTLIQAAMCVILGIALLVMVVHYERLMKRSPVRITQQLASAHSEQSVFLEWPKKSTPLAEYHGPISR